MKSTFKLILAAAGAALALASGGAEASPIGYAVQSDNDDKLYSIDLATGVATAIGPTGLLDIEGLSFQPGTGILFGANNGSADQLVTINTSTGAATVVGSFGFNLLDDLGLTFGASGTLFLADEGTQSLYTVNTGTGAATLVGSTGQPIVSLAYFGSTLFGLSEACRLFTINTGTGAASLVGSVGSVCSTEGEDGIDFDPATGILYGIGDETNNVYTIDTSTGAGTLVADLSGCTNCAYKGNFEGLAIASVPEPASLLLLGSGLLGLGLWARKRMAD